MPKVSIVLPLYNAEKDVRECIESIKNQSFKDYEFVIVEDKSTDKTREIIDGINLHETTDNVAICYHNTNQGFAAAVNKGIALAAGEYIMIADHDVVYDKDYLKDMIDNGSDVIGGRMFYYDQKDMIRCFGIQVSLVTGKTKIIGRDEIDKGQFKELHKIFAIPGGALMFRKIVVDTIGLFDENFNKYYVDVDFCLRAKKAGFDAFLSDAKCWHKKEKIYTFDKPHLHEYYQDKARFLKLHSPYYPINLIPIKIKEALS